ncbi:hypothetical protein EI427_17810 [Flammeovirga pectinis]|uniref:TonB-dependent receptor n=1 Tax=Flammeovirga pectinis TaxID=2494373 RepID=A0A3S9P788_9BACT|nr:hypothetical protein [Flammeovirga pectinis]AZQ64014.1 hypothetical protein EI427_17810 [Flammeovirga pectinis]
MRKQINRVAITFGLAILPMLSNGQSLISGYLEDENQLPIIGGSIVLLSKQDSSILDYAISDVDGYFEINSRRIEEKMLCIRFLGFETKFIHLQSTMYLGRITLATKTEVLQEVLIKNPPIDVLNDTIEYSIQSFAKQSDYSLEDVLKNMPGIEVSETGTIKYQGELLNKFYIEGVDVLEGKYALATKNLSHEKIASVQILEHHQPIAMLRGKQINYKPSMNIVLKGASVFNGKVGIYGGIDVHKKGLLQLNVTPMFFSKSHQFIGSFQFDNTGKEILNQLEIHTFIKSPFNKDNFHLYVTDYAIPFLTKERGLLNQTSLSTINASAKTKKGTMKINVDYLNDEQRQNVENQRVYFTTNVDTILRSQHSVTVIDDLSVKVIYEINTEEKYLKNTTQLQYKKNNEFTQVLQFSDTINQPILQETIKVGNVLNGKVKVNETIFSVNSELYSSTSNETIHFIDTLENLHKQLITTNYLETKQEIANSWFIGPIMIENKLGFQYNHTQLLSNINGENNAYSSTLFTNNQNTDFLEGYVQEQFTYSFSRGQIDLKFPIAYQFINLENTPHNVDQSKQVLFIAPKLFVSWDISNNLTVKLNSNFSTDPQYSSIYYGIIVENYTRLSKNASPIYWNKMLLNSGNLQYKNPSLLLFGYITYTHKIIFSDYLNEVQIGTQGEIITTLIDETNEKKYQIFSINGSKVVVNKVLSASLKIDFSDTKQEQIVNNEIIDFKLQQVKYTGKLDLYPLTWLNVNISASRMINQNVTYSSLSTLDNLSCELNLNLAENFFSFNVHYILPSNYSSVTFCDFKYQFKQRKYSFSIAVNNVFNQETWAMKNVNSLYQEDITYKIRPLQVVGGITYKF